ncbi:MAG: hypothetical protein ACW99A_08720 [Candidatus Kariarchaeaceae archaeon]|jgi:hypothetical protein
MTSDEDIGKEMESRNTHNDTWANYDLQNDAEDLSFDLLFNTLDSIFEDNSETKQTQEHQIENENKFQNLTGLISKLYNSTTWNKLNQVNEERPVACFACFSISCQHVKNKGSQLDIEAAIDKALEKCDHKISDDWLFDDMCAKCIITSCEKVSASGTPSLGVLWDESDLMDYNAWLGKIDDETFKLN